MTKEVKLFGFEFEMKEASEGMAIEGYGSTFGNKDSVGDVVERGAFTKSLSQRMPKMFWQHDSRQLPGIWTAAAEDERGLYLKGHLLNTTLGRDVYELAKAGAIEQMSIGYSVKNAAFSADKKTRMLKEVSLFEVSLVTFPANEEARIIAVKSLPQTVREYEEFLRDAGFSVQQAKHIASAGFKEADNLRDASTAELIESLNKLTAQLKGS